MKLDDLDRLVLTVVGLALLALLAGGALLLALAHGVPPQVILPPPGLH